MALHDLHGVTTSRTSPARLERRGLRARVAGQPLHEPLRTATHQEITMEDMENSL